MRVHLFQVSEDLLILAIVIITDAMALVDNQQRKFAAKQLKVAGNRLARCRTPLCRGLFRFSPAAKISASDQAQYLAWFCANQLFDVRQHNA